MIRCLIVTLSTRLFLCYATGCSTWIRENWVVDDITGWHDVTFVTGIPAIDGKAGDVVNLKMDIYEPPPTDLRTERPAMLLVHGGSFNSGDKTSDGIPYWAIKLAQHGFVAASMDYRLLGDYDGPEVAQEAFAHEFIYEHGVEDIRLAVKFLRDRAGTYRIDRDRISLGGDSAGAILSLYYGYVANPNMGSGEFASSSVRTISSLSGQLNTEFACSSISPTGRPTGCYSQASKPDLTNNIGLKQFRTPLAIISGTDDTLLPYFHSGTGNYQAGIANGMTPDRDIVLITIDGGGHVPMMGFLHEEDSDHGNFGPYMTFLIQNMDLDNAQCPMTWLAQSGNRFLSEKVYV